MYDPNLVETKTSIAALRINVSPFPAISIQGYYAGGSTGGGIFNLILSDTTSADNGGTIIVDAAGHRYYRDIGANRISVQDFGAVADCNGTTGTDNADAFDAFFAEVVSSGRGGRIPAGWYYCSRKLAPLVLTTLTQGIDIIGDGYVAAWNSTSVDTRVFFAATASGTGIMLSITTTAPATDSYSKVRFSDWGIQATPATKGIATGLRMVGIAPDLRRFGAVKFGTGVDARNFDGGFTEKCYIVRNKVCGLRLQAAYEFVDIASDIIENNTHNEYGDPSPWTGTNIIIEKGIYATAGFGMRFIRTNVNSAPGFKIDDCSDVTLDEIEAELCANATTSYQPVLAGTVGPVVNLKILAPHTQNTQIALTNVSGPGTYIENEGPIRVTTDTLGIRTGSAGKTVPVCFPSNHRFSQGITPISPNFCADGDLANALGYGIGGIPGPLSKIAGAATVSIGANNSIPLIAGRSFLRVDVSGGSGSPYATTVWANNAGSYSLQSRQTISLDFVCRNGTTFPSLTVVFSGLDSGGTPVADVAETGFGNLDSTINGEPIIGGNGFAQFSNQIAIPTTNNLQTVTGIAIQFNFGSNGNWDIGYCSISMGSCAQPNQLPTCHNMWPHELPAVASGATVTLSNLGASGFRPVITIEGPTYGFYTISGPDIIISTGSATPYKAFLVWVPRADIPNMAGG